MRMLKSVWLCIASLIYVSSPAIAQITTEPIYSPDFIMRQNDISFNPVVNDVIERGKKSKENPAKPQTNAVVKPNWASLNYKPSPARTRQNLSNFVAKVRTSDPKMAAQLEQAFASTDVIATVGGAMRKLGLSPNNVAHVYAIYWISAWQAVHGETSDRNAATYQAVAAQAVQGFSATPQFARTTDAQKQEMAETLMIQTVMIDSAKDSAAGNSIQLRAVADAVRKGAKASGLDLDAMELTEQGFKPVRK